MTTDHTTHTGGTMITDRDIRTQVTAIIDPEFAEGIDIDGVVRTVIDRHGLVNVDTIDADEYWGIVAQHDTTQA